MERVDVVVVGQGTCALVAAARAAREGVRANLVDMGPRLADSPSLVRIEDRDASAVELPSGAIDRSFTRGDGEVEHRVLASALGAHLEQRARSAGAELRLAHDRPVSVRLDADGWRVSMPGGEPIRAPVLVLAEGARAPILGELGIAAAQRMCPDGADILTEAVATWTLPPSELAKHEAPRVERGPGLSKVELWAGRDRVTVRVGPIWSSGAGWPSPEHPRVRAVVARAARMLGLPLRPTAIELEETRLDALPFPPTFDGGLVVGLGAGHAVLAPERRVAALARLGDLAGHAAANAILRDARSAHALGEALGPAYRAAFEACVASAIAPVVAPRAVFAGFAG